MRNLYKKYLYFFIIVFCQSLYTIGMSQNNPAFKSQFSAIQPTGFKFIYSQVLIVLFVYALCYPISWLLSKLRAQEYEIKKNQAKTNGFQITFRNYVWLKIFALSICDIIFLVIQFVCLDLLQPSMFQLIKVSELIMIYQFNRKIKIGQKKRVIIFCVAIFVLLVSTFYQIFHKQVNNRIQNIAFLLLLFSLVIQKISQSLEKEIVKQYYLKPFEIIGLRGCFAIIFILFAFCSNCYFNNCSLINFPIYHGTQLISIIAILCTLVSLLAKHKIEKANPKQLFLIIYSIISTTLVISLIVTILVGKQTQSYFWQMPFKWQTKEQFIYQFLTIIFTIFAYFLYCLTFKTQKKEKKEQIQEKEKMQVQEKKERKEKILEKQQIQFLLINDLTQSLLDEEQKI